MSATLVDEITMAGGRKKDAAPVAVGFALESRWLTQASCSSCD
jgi:hypothetical protein